MALNNYLPQSITNFLTYGQMAVAEEISDIIDNKMKSNHTKQLSEWLMSPVMVYSPTNLQSHADANIQRIKDIIYVVDLFNNNGQNISILLFSNRVGNNVNVSNQDIIGTIRVDITI